MRKEIVAQRSLLDQAIAMLLNVFKPSKELRKMDSIIDANPDIVGAIHADLTDGSKDSGRSGISTERILRAAILKQRKGYSYRELRERIHEGVAFRWFTRFYCDPIPHFTSLQKAIKSIKSTTWNRINEILVQYARSKKVENGKSLGIDTTVVETNIAYPIDARLLWDSIRVLTRIMEASRTVLPDLNFAFAKRTRRANKRCYAIVMAKGPKAKQRRQKLYKDLIKVANEVFRMASGCCEQLRKCPHIEAMLFYQQLDHYLTLTAAAIDQCERRMLRGKSQSPTEFGHKVLVTTGKSGLVTQYETFHGNPSDSDMLSGTLTQHQKQYGEAPHSICGDRRFFSQENEGLAYRNHVKKVSICKPGYRSKARQQIQKQSWFKKLQRFRAGIEGIISALMRGYGLKRCLWKGWRSFKSYVGLGVVTFNLQKLAKLT
jgi:IS5 family transposase